MADELRAPRGMHDLLPEDAALWAHVRDTAEAVAHRFGYRPIATPIVEDAKVFLRTAGDESDIVQKEVYLFEDRGNDRLALRPEGTAGVCRAYLEHGMGSWPQPVRLYYFGPFFRYDRPQAGRYRQLWQFGAEAIGSDSPALDAELIDLQSTLYREVGLTGVALRVNSIGTAETRARYIEALRAHFAPHVGTLSRDSQRRYETNILRVLDSKEDNDHPAVRHAPSILDFLDEADREHFEAVKGHLDALGIAYSVDPRIVRGLDYYSRTVWEFEPAGHEGSQGAVGGGGRYDGLMELLGGPPTPAVGFGAGVDRIALNLKAREVTSPLRAFDVVTVRLGQSEEATKIALKAASALRAKGLSVQAGVPGRSLRASLRSADASGASVVLVIGEAEAQENAVTFKPLFGDGQQLVKIGIFPQFARMFLRVTTSNEHWWSSRRTVKAMHRAALLNLVRDTELLDLTEEKNFVSLRSSDVQWPPKLRAEASEVWKDWKREGVPALVDSQETREVFTEVAHRIQDMSPALRKDLLKPPAANRGR